MFRDGLSDRGVGLATSGSCTTARVLGPPKNELVLEGIRYDLIERALRGVPASPFNLRPIARGRRRFAPTSCCCSSATKEVLPVTTLDGAASATARCAASPGPVYARLYEAYQQRQATQSI